MGSKRQINVNSSEELEKVNDRVWVRFKQWSARGETQCFSLINLQVLDAMIEDQFEINNFPA